MWTATSINGSGAWGKSRPGSDTISRSPVVTSNLGMGVTLEGGALEIAPPSKRGLAGPGVLSSALEEEPELIMAEPSLQPSFKRSDGENRISQSPKHLLYRFHFYPKSPCQVV